MALRSPVQSVDHRIVSFRAQLLQQMVGSLDRDSMSMNETEVRVDAFILKRSAPSGSKHPAAIDAPGSGGGTLPFESATHRRHGPRAATQAVAMRHPRPAPAHPSLPQPVPPAAVPAVSAAPKASVADGFLNKLAGAAQATASALGLSPHLLLAQAALETGWGRKVIKDLDGQDSYNLFAIKAGGQWTGKTMEVRTTEYVHGVAQNKVASFRAYASYAEAFSDYARLIKHRYGDAMAKGATAEGFGQALQAGGYATDPHYAQKIARVAQSVAYRLPSQSSGNADLA